MWHTHTTTKFTKELGGCGPNRCGSATATSRVAGRFMVGRGVTRSSMRCDRFNGSLTDGKGARGSGGGEGLRNVWPTHHHHHHRHRSFVGPFFVAAFRVLTFPIDARTWPARMRPGLVAAVRVWLCVCARQGHTSSCIHGQPEQGYRGSTSVLVHEIE